MQGHHGVPCGSGVLKERLFVSTVGISALLIAAASSASACDLCAVYSAGQARGQAGTGFFTGVAEQFTDFETLQDGGHRIPSEGGSIKSAVSQLLVGYDFNPRFGLQLNLPLIYRSYASATDHGSEAGIGDVSLLGNAHLYQRLWDRSSVDFSLLAGLKLPTGDSAWLGRPDFTDGIGGHDLALGSGSFDGIVGSGFLFTSQRFLLSSTVQYAIRSEGDFGHQYANDLTWTIGPGAYLALSHHYTVALQAVVSGEYKGKDTFAGVPDDDSAETIVSVGPQLTLTWSRKLSALVGLDLPVHIDNSGVQVVPDYRLRAALTWRF